jgi:hypothetical protein
MWMALARPKGVPGWSCSWLYGLLRASFLGAPSDRPAQSPRRWLHDEHTITAGGLAQAGPNLLQRDELRRCRFSSLEVPCRPTRPEPRVERRQIMRPVELGGLLPQPSHQAPLPFRHRAWAAFVALIERLVPIDSPSTGNANAIDNDSASFVVELRVGLGDLVARMVAFIRAGYPQGVG